MEHKVRSYRDLVAWQKARVLVREVYLLTATFPVGERFGLVSQMDRAAVSIPSNIAEGYGRSTTQDWVRFSGENRTGGRGQAIGNRAGDAASPRGGPRPVLDGEWRTGGCDTEGGHPSPQRTRHGGGKKGGRLKSSIPIAYCPTPHPWVRFFA